MSISVCTLSLSLVLWLAMGLSPQRPSNWPSPPASAQQMPEARGPSKPSLEQSRQASEQRKLQAQNDTERLAKLVNQLKQDLEHTPADVLSLDAVKKSKEVEKLAKKVSKEVQQD